MKLGVLAEEEAAVASLQAPIATLYSDRDCNSGVDSNYLVADNVAVGDLAAACAERNALLQRSAHGFPAHHYYYYRRHRRGNWDDGSCCWDPSHRLAEFEIESEE